MFLLGTLPFCLSQWGRPPLYKRGKGQYPARLSGGFQSPTEINASGGSQPRKVEGASHHARRGKNAEAFLKWGKSLSQSTLIRIPCQVPRARLEKENERSLKKFVHNIGTAVFATKSIFVYRKCLLLYNVLCINRRLQELFQ